MGEDQTGNSCCRLCTNHSGSKQNFLGVGVQVYFVSKHFTLTWAHAATTWVVQISNFDRKMKKSRYQQYHLSVGAGKTFYKFSLSDDPYPADAFQNIYGRLQCYSFLKPRDRWCQGGG